MKKILSLALAALMLVSAVPMVYAAEPTIDNGAEGSNTVVSYTGTGEEYYTLTVPATMNPGDAKDLKLVGQWPANKKVTVTVPYTVTLTSETNDSQTIKLQITGGSMEVRGNDFTLISQRQQMEIQQLVGSEAPDFGTWTGTIEYTVTVSEISDSE